MKMATDRWFSTGVAVAVHVSGTRLLNNEGAARCGSFNQTCPFVLGLSLHELHEHVAPHLHGHSSASVGALFSSFSAFGNKTGLYFTITHVTQAQ